MSNSYDPTFPPPAPYAEPEKKGCGCWVWGCLTVFLLFVVGSASVGFFGYRYLGGQIARFTEDKPVELPTVQYDEQTLADLEARLESFKDDGTDQSSIDELTLTADDINALIHENESMRGRVFVRMDNNQLTGDVSMPLDGVPMGGGRFLNASVTLDVSMHRDRLDIRLVSAEVKGEPVPGEFIGALGSENLAAELYNDKNLGPVLERLQDVRIEDNQLILKLHPAEASELESAADTTETL